MNMDNYLTSMGYYANTITDTVFYDNRKATVHYTVMPGKTYMIDTVILGQADTALSDLYYRFANRSLITPGSRLSSLTLEQEAARISSYMRNNGYYGFNRSHVSFLADTLAGEGKASCRYSCPTTVARNLTGSDKLTYIPDLIPSRPLWILPITNLWRPLNTTG